MNASFKKKGGRALINTQQQFAIIKKEMYENLF